jgi:glycosyltransferase involved in cell wall biosynthesis
LAGGKVFFAIIMAKIAVNLLTWNGAKYLPHILNSLRQQTFLNWKLYILDNASSDETVSILKKELVNFPVEHEIFFGKKILALPLGKIFSGKKALRNMFYF